MPSDAPMDDEELAKLYRQAHRKVGNWYALYAEARRARASEAALRAENERLVAQLERECITKTSVTLILDTQDFPFNRFECSIEDIGHSDRILVVASKELQEYVDWLEAKAAPETRGKGEGE